MLVNVDHVMRKKKFEANLLPLKKQNSSPAGFRICSKLIGIENFVYGYLSPYQIRHHYKKIVRLDFTTGFS